MEYQVHKKVKLSEQSTIITEQQQNRPIISIPDIITLQSVEVTDILRYSPIKGLSILDRLIQDQLPELLSKIISKQIVIHKQLMIHLYSIETQNIQMFNLALQGVQSLDKDIREHSLQYMTSIKAIDEKLILPLIYKCKDSQELIQSQCSRGVLIQILEDQYMQVRINGIKVIDHFSTLSQEFQNLVQEILIYMLNDEMDAVRIQAIIALKAYNKIEFCKVDSNAIIFNINESNYKLRMAIYQLIGISIFREVTLDIFNTLCANLKKFPADFVQLGLTLKQLSKNNYLTLEEVLHQNWFAQEPDWNNQEYILRMVFIRGQNYKEQLFYFSKHFDYLQDKFPDFFESQTIVPIKSFRLLRELKSFINQDQSGKYCQNKTFVKSKITELKYALEAQCICEGLNIKTQRKFRFLEPMTDKTIKIFPEIYTKIGIIGEFDNLKEPISKNYQFRVTFIDQQQQYFKIRKYDIEDRVIQTKILLGRLIQGFSQELKIEFVDKDVVIESLIIYLQI